MEYFVVQYTNRKTARLINKLTDKEILGLIHSNKDSGFRVLMHEYQEQIYWHIRRMVVTHEDADDVVQNTFVKIFRNIDGFKGDSKLYTWLYRIATNESITYLKSKNRRRTESIDGNESMVENRISGDQYFDGTKAQLILQRAIVTLPEKQKAVFNLRYFDEMPYNEMSEVLETSVGALKASYHHAVKKIEEFIKNEK